jgi:formylglycine-generating enzyme required for sulfatase activity
MMGSEESLYEQPVHEVEIIYEFWLARTETTNAQFRQFRSDQAIGKDDDLPAINLSWNAAKEFCEQYGWRLPTETEWEYAARAGTETRWSFDHNEDDLDQYAWYSRNSGRRAHPVGTRDPNLLGIYDMYGNVSEWVQDCWNDNCRGAPSNGDAWEEGDCSWRVRRGGAFDDVAWAVLSGNRNSAKAEGGDRPEFEFGFDRIGFRCARGPRRQR